MPINHVVIWIDHREAHILYFDLSKSKLIQSESPYTHLHHKVNEIGSGNAPEDREFFNNVISALSDTNEILVIGPGSAKVELLKFAATNNPSIAQKVIGIETVDHPTDLQVLAYAKKYFNRIDNLR